MNKILQTLFVLFLVAACDPARAVVQASQVYNDSTATGTTQADVNNNNKQFQGVPQGQNGICVDSSAAPIWIFKICGTNAIVANAMVFNLNSVAAQTAPGGTILNLVEADSTNGGINIDGFTGTGRYGCRRGDGTNASTTAVQSGELLCSFEGWGWGATTWSTSGRGAVRMLACQNWTDTGQCAAIGFYTTSVGSTTLTQRCLINGDGGLTCGSVTDQGAGTIAALNGVYSGTTQLVNTGELIKTDVINATTTPFTVTLTTSASTNSMRARIQCAGAGGGGVASNAAGNGDSAGGGSTGGYLDTGLIAVTPSTTYTFTLPPGGTGGANTGANGNQPGSDCSLVVGATTYTAKQGNGGLFLATGATFALVLGGSATAISTNGAINGAGQAGGWGMIFTAGTTGIGGEGGSTAFGAGGSPRKTTGIGNNGTGYGCGGGGALSGASGAGQAGGNGCDSIAWVEEYK